VGSFTTEVLPGLLIVMALVKQSAMEHDPFLPETLEGWLAIARNVALTALAVIGLVWRAVTNRINAVRVEVVGEDGEGGAIGDLKGDILRALALETEHRKTADSNIEGVVERNAQLLHNYMGKLDLVTDQLITMEKQQLREMSALREELRVGFAELRRDYRGDR
jgi:hypothetical protein